MNFDKYFIKDENHSDNKLEKWILSPSGANSFDKIIFEQKWHWIELNLSLKSGLSGLNGHVPVSKI